MKRIPKIYGMVHLQALPATPANRLGMAQIADIALAESELYHKNGLDGIIIENMHDVPYQKRRVNDEIVAAMAIIASKIRLACDFDIGIQILAGANRQALAVAHSAGLDFIRAEGFVFGHLADEGYMDSDAAELLRYRKQIGAEQIAIFTDIKKKHSSHASTSDISLIETARAAAFFRSDGVIVTGSSTGKAPKIAELKTLRDNLPIPVLIGSGIDVDNIADFYNLADIFIVGSHFKKEGRWENPLDENRVAGFMQRVRELGNTF